MGSLGPVTAPLHPPFLETTPSRTVGDLVASDASVPAQTLVRAVAEEFFAQPALEAVALLSAGRPVGLLTRGRLLLKLARGFGQELYARKPVSRIADLEPLVVPSNMPLRDALSLALGRPTPGVYDDLVVTDEAGTYLGLVSVREVVLEQSVAHARTAAAHDMVLSRAADLERLDALRARFLAHATHELRSPVNAIAALAETIRLAVGRGDLPGVGTRVELLLRSAAVLRGTVNNILDLSRIEAGKVELVRARLAVAPFLEELAVMARLLIGAKPVTVRVEVPAELALDSDRSKLRQAVLNLVSNAAKFTEEGEVVLAAAEEAGGVRLEVRDTGPGIRAEDLDRLFVPFGQLDDARVKAKEGTGLGLVIARSLAELLGGRIDVQSRRGEGSTFALHLSQPSEWSRAA